MTSKSLKANKSYGGVNDAKRQKAIMLGDTCGAERRFLWFQTLMKAAKKQKINGKWKALHVHRDGDEG